MISILEIGLGIYILVQSIQRFIAARVGLNRGSGPPYVVGSWARILSIGHALCALFIIIVLGVLPLRGVDYSFSTTLIMVIGLFIFYVGLIQVARSRGTIEK
jgi:hypothetical protein